MQLNFLFSVVINFIILKIEKKWLKEHYKASLTWNARQIWTYGATCSLSGKNSPQSFHQKFSGVEYIFSFVSFRKLC